MTDMTDIRKKDDKALVELIKEKREAVRNFRFSSTGSSLRDVRQVRTDKKDIARVLTELNARAKQVESPSNSTNDK